MATKESGGITGEERIRENLGALYGDVNGYDGRPTDYQVARAESLGRELEDAIVGFRKLMEKELPTINAELQKKKLESDLGADGGRLDKAARRVLCEISQRRGTRA